MADNKVDEIGGSILFMLFILLGLGGMILLLINSNFSLNIKETIIGVIFATMILAGVTLWQLSAKDKIISFGNFGEASLSFTIGLILWSFFGSASPNSVLSSLTISSNTLFSAISSELPLHLEFILEAFVIPISEETFWMIGIPVTIIVIMNLAAKEYNRLAWMKNPIVQIIVVSLIAGTSFAAFHVGKNLLSFIFAAILFRTILTALILSEQEWNWIKNFDLVIAFAYGAHIGNNLGAWGIKNGFNILVNHIEIGWIVFALFGLIFLGAINKIILLIAGKQEG